MSKFRSLVSSQPQLPVTQIPQTEDYLNPSQYPVPQITPESRVIPPPEEGGVNPLTTVNQGIVPEVGQELTPQGEVVPAAPDTSFNEQENQRLALPSQPLDFSSEEAALRTLQNIQQENIPTKQLDVMGNFMSDEAKKQSSFKDKSPADLVATASWLQSRSQELANDMFGSPNSALMRNENHVSNYLGLNTYPTPAMNEAAMARLPGAALVVLSDMAKQGYIQNIGQVGEEGLYKSKKKGEQDTEFADKPSNELLQEVTTSEEAKEAFKEVAQNPQKHRSAHAAISSIAPRLKELIHGAAPSSEKEAGKYAADSDILASYSFAVDALNSGYLSVGRDKYGAVHIVPGPKLDWNTLRQLEEVSNAYNDMTRGNAFVAQKNAPVNGIPANAAARFITDQTERGTSAVEIVMSLIDNIAITTNPLRLKTQQKMFDDIRNNLVFFVLDSNTPEGYRYILPEEWHNNPNILNSSTVVAYSESQFGESLLNMTKARFQELLDVHGIFETDFQGNTRYDEKGNPILNRIVSTVGKNKMDQIQTHIYKYLDKLSSGLFYGMMKMSPVTHRMFQRATDINWINHSGTIRAGIAFGRVEQMFIKDPVALINTAKSLSNALDKVPSKGIEERGVKQIELYQSASKDKQLAMGATYIMASIAHELDLPSMGPLRKHYTINDMINAFNEDTFNDMASKGASVLAWLNNDADFPAWLNPKKKEWAPVFDAVIMAYNMRQAKNAGGKLVPLDAIIEKDSSQSNAILQALTIGDMQVARLLGANLYNSNIETEFKNLREKAASTIEQDIAETMTGPDEREAEEREALINFFGNVKDKISNFSKVYARGIVVAGLYGKHPSFMFEEAETMLAEIEQQGLGNEVNKLKSKFNTEEDLLKAIAAVYTKSFYTHMESLSLYQQVMKSLAAINAAAYGSTIFKTYGDQVVDMASSFGILTKVDKDRIQKQYEDFALKNSYIPGTGGMPYQVTEDISVSPYGTQKDIRASGQAIASHSKNKRIQEGLAPEEDLGYYSGKSFRDAFPVVTTQSGDSFLWAIASLATHKHMKATNAMNLLPIHDAVLGDPSSIIPFVISYNNIGMPKIAKEAERMWRGFYDQTMNSVKDAMVKVEKAKGANIGREGDYAALSAYFDELWHYSNTVPEGAKRGRQADINRYSKKKQKNDEILAQASKAGWIPPTKENTVDKYNQWVSPKQFKELMDLLKESTGFGDSGYNKKNLESFISNVRNVVHRLSAVNRDIVNLR